ncbi:uncharacterized protein K452DRAFT_336382 [Aplosporella prunicola CBS 121167]|uniref:Uncharacterized protein n=1 Tax=Aplosporella prunicola CBS 121167 TaxID=1176127 RepID=A0A6A6B6G7_9PEZI|nr:uncharacterized protein K452DRAFT_336382 [Aplosporella prunicola CBS 121167]KAF2139699.1 hypothetical protein K452DRAFT_336382 [Aplosporella prunicola CBS 121167]
MSGFQLHSGGQDGTTTAPAPAFPDTYITYMYASAPLPHIHSTPTHTHRQQPTNHPSIQSAPISETPPQSLEAQLQFEQQTATEYVGQLSTAVADRLRSHILLLESRLALQRHQQAQLLLQEQRLLRERHATRLPFRERGFEALARTLEHDDDDDEEDEKEEQQLGLEQMSLALRPRQSYALPAASAPAVPIQTPTPQIQTPKCACGICPLGGCDFSLATENGTCMACRCGFKPRERCPCGGCWKGECEFEDTLEGQCECCSCTARGGRVSRK